MQLKQLEDERRKIDEIDRKILELTSERLQIAGKIADLKEKENLTMEDKEREKSLREKWEKEAEIHGLNREAATKKLSKILEESKKHQNAKLKHSIAIQGAKGSFSELISMKIFESYTHIPCKTFNEVFNTVASGDAFYGVIPVENSITGRIRGTTDLLAASKSIICGEATLAINHALIAKPGQKVKDIKKIFAHTEALRQCRNFTETLKNVELIAWCDGAHAAQKVKDGENIAIIASKETAELHGLEVLKEGIQDAKINRTKFYIIGNHKCEKSGDDSTTIFFRTKNKPGALLSVLDPLERGKINMTKLESIPDPENAFEYSFWLDFDGHRDEENVSKALNEMAKHCISLKVLGSYPKRIDFEVG